MVTLAIRELNYDLLPDQEARDLRDAEAFINGSIDRNFALRQQMRRLELESHAVIVGIGDKLIEMKDKYPGEFMLWRRQCFVFSDDTAENMMNVARNYRILPEGAYTQTALYDLSRKSSDVRQAIEARAASGITIDRDEVTLQSHAPRYLLAAYHNGDISKKEALQITQQYNRDPDPEFHNLVNDLQLKTVSALDFLHKVWKAHNGTWARLRSDEFYLTGTGVHLSNATERDIDSYAAFLAEEKGDQYHADRVKHSNAIRCTGHIEGQHIIVDGQIISNYSGRKVEIWMRIND